MRKCTSTVEGNGRAVEEFPHVYVFSVQQAMPRVLQDILNSLHCLSQSLSLYEENLSICCSLHYLHKTKTRQKTHLQIFLNSRKPKNEDIKKPLLFLLGKGNGIAFQRRPPMGREECEEGKGQLMIMGGKVHQGLNNNCLLLTNFYKQTNNLR